MFELVTSQLTDLFRIGMLCALVYTTLRNRETTGIVLPLVAGMLFVAVIIPVTMPKPEIPLWRLVAAGLVANAMITAAAWTISKALVHKP